MCLILFLLVRKSKDNDPITLLLSFYFYFQSGFVLLSVFSVFLAIKRHWENTIMSISHFVSRVFEHFLYLKSTFERTKAYLVMFVSCCCIVSQTLSPTCLRWPEKMLLLWKMLLFFEHIMYLHLPKSLSSVLIWKYIINKK